MRQLIAIMNEQGVLRTEVAARAGLSICGMRDWGMRKSPQVVTLDAAAKCPGLSAGARADRRRPAAQGRRAMKFARHDQATARAIEHVAWLRAQGVSIGEAIEALPWAYRSGATCWDAVCWAYARAWLESPAGKAKP